jgi:hypothetical protein
VVDEEGPAADEDAAEAGAEEEAEVTGAEEGDAPIVSVTGQTVVLTAIVSVTTEP